MTGESCYLKVQWPADALALTLLRESRTLTGEFIREDEPPWALWFYIQGHPDWMSRLEMQVRGCDTDCRPWEVGEPSGSVTKADWLDILWKFVLRPSGRERLQEAVLLRTTHLEQILGVIREHFLLQQGQMEIARFSGEQPWWFLRIRQPSRWALDMMADRDSDSRWYHQVPEAPGLFVEAGWNLSDPVNGLRLNRLTLLENAVILVNGTGEIEQFRPAWKSGNNLIEITCPSPHIIQEEETARILIEPRFRPMTDAPRPSLWYVEDARRLQDILANEVVEQFSGFSAWFTKGREVWVLGAGARSDQGLADLFSDAFPGFYRLQDRVFLPRGQALSPQLAEDRLRKIFSCPDRDFLCLDQTDAVNLKATILPAQTLHPLDFFLTFQAESTLKSLEPFSSRWTFTFPDVKKKG